MKALLMTFLLATVALAQVQPKIRLVSDIDTELIDGGLKLEINHESSAEQIKQAKAHLSDISNRLNGISKRAEMTSKVWYKLSKGEYENSDPLVNDYKKATAWLFEIKAMPSVAKERADILNVEQDLTIYDDEDGNHDISISLETADKEALTQAEIAGSGQIFESAIPHKVEIQDAYMSDSELEASVLAQIQAALEDIYHVVRKEYVAQGHSWLDSIDWQNGAIFRTDSTSIESSQQR